MASLTICDVCFKKGKDKGPALPPTEKYQPAVVEFRRIFNELDLEGFVVNKGAERVHHLCRTHFHTMMNVIQDVLIGEIMDEKEVTK